MKSFSGPPRKKGRVVIRLHMYAGLREKKRAFRVFLHVFFAEREGGARAVLVPRDSDVCERRAQGPTPTSPLLKTLVLLPLFRLAQAPDECKM